MSSPEEKDAFALFLHRLQNETTTTEEIQNLIKGFYSDQHKNNRPELSIAQKLDLFSTFVGKNVDLAVYKTAKDMLNIDKDENFKAELEKSMEKATLNGNMELPAIKLLFHCHVITRDILHYALLIGYDDDKEIKELVKSEQFPELRKWYQETNTWADDKNSWMEAVEKYDLLGKNHLMMHAAFAENNKNNKFKRAFESPAISQINHQINNRYKAGDIDWVQLFEIIYHIIAHSSDIKADVVKAMQNDKLPDEQIEQIRSINFANVTNPNSVPDVEKNRMWADKEKPKNFLLWNNKVPIHFITTDKELNELSKKLEEVSDSDYPYVGIDTELNNHQTNQVKYFQLALKEAVYLMKISKEYSPEQAEFCSKLFSNEKITKIGFGITAQTDYRNLPHRIKSIQQNVHDLQKDMQKDIKKKHLKLPPTAGLSKMCELYLGHPLDKSESCSVWSREPLRQAQKEYAALDAYCLLMIRDKMDSEGNWKRATQ